MGITAVQLNLHRPCGVLTIVVKIQPDPGIVEVTVDYPPPLVGRSLTVGNTIELPAINRQVIGFIATAGDRK